MTQAALPIVPAVNNDAVSDGPSVDVNNVQYEDESLPLVLDSVNDVHESVPTVNDMDLPLVLDSVNDVHESVLTVNDMDIDSIPIVIESGNNELTCSCTSLSWLFSSNLDQDSLFKHIDEQNLNLKSENSTP